MSSEEQLLTLDIALLRLDGGTQVRAKLARSLVKEYAERMEAGDVFPPVVVAFDGQHYWLADGFHRLHAHLELKRTAIECRVFEGTVRDAVLVALKANSAHGLRRSNADKRRAVEIVLTDEEWSKKSTRWIATVCGVSRELVEAMRRELPATNPFREVAETATHPAEVDQAATVRLGQDGRLYAAHHTTSSQPTAEGADPLSVALSAGEKFDGCLVRLKKVANEVERLARAPGGAYLTEPILADVQSNLNQAYNLLRGARPVSRCRFCQGTGCERCNQTGWLSAIVAARYL
jgi:ParB-like chromosome segregation protein Spo0J